MAQELQKIFLGNTPADQRRYLTEVLKALKPKNERVVIPCCGQFTLAKCAIAAGFKPSQIETSDISFFSSILGYLYAGRSLDTLDFGLGPEMELANSAVELIRQSYAAKSTEAEKVAYLLWLIKLSQIRTDVYYERLVYDELIRRRKEQIEQLANKLAENAKFYEGIRYDVMDMRKVIREHERGTILIINPPAYAKGYEKMFPIDAFVNFCPNVCDWDLAKEYIATFEETCSYRHPVIWYKYKNINGLDPSKVIFAKEYSPVRFDFWLMNQPELLEGDQVIVWKKLLKIKPYKNAPVWKPNDELSRDSTVQFAKIGDEYAMYYRDLWAHKLGNTKSEAYFLILVDGKAFGVVAFHMSDIFRLANDRVHETFGFSAPSDRYPNINRLLMYLITTTDMGRVIRATSSKKNRIYDLNGIRTACLSKYRDVKLNKGILKRTAREKLPNGMYKIDYAAQFRDETFGQALCKYLDEWELKHGASKQSEERTAS